MGERQTERWERDRQRDGRETDREMGETQTDKTKTDRRRGRLMGIQADGAMYER
jgi:hypothetical protein